MTTEDIITYIFCYVDDRMKDVPKHPQAELYPSEVVTIGLLFALKGGYFSPFDRWLRRDYPTLFPGLPERTRLQRLLKTHQAWFERFLVEPSFFTVMDTYPIELLFPIREGRSPSQVGKKGRDKGRWSIGLKLCWLLTTNGRVVAWDWDTLNTPDKAFHHVAQPFEGETIVCVDEGFRSKEGIPPNLKICKKGTWNERMFIETALSMVTVVCDLKRIHHRVSAYITARLACVSAMFNVLLDLSDTLFPNSERRMSICEFSL